MKSKLVFIFTDGIIPPTTPPPTTVSPVANLAPKIVRNTPTEEDVVVTLKPEPMKKIVSTASNMSYPAQVSGTVSQIVQKKNRSHRFVNAVYFY